MTNYEKYRTVEERTEAFLENFEGGYPTPETVSIFANWLEKEAEEEKPLPCPFCGCKTTISRLDGFYTVVCLNTAKCRYFAKRCKTYHEAVEVHNHVAKAVMDANMEKSR